MRRYVLACAAVLALAVFASGSSAGLTRTGANLVRTVVYSGEYSWEDTLRGSYVDKTTETMTWNERMTRTFDARGNVIQETRKVVAQGRLVKTYSQAPQNDVDCTFKQKGSIAQSDFPIVSFGLQGNDKVGFQVTIPNSLDRTLDGKGKNCPPYGTILNDAHALIYPPKSFYSGSRAYDNFFNAFSVTENDVSITKPFMQKVGDSVSGTATGPGGKQTAKASINGLITACSGVCPGGRLGPPEATGGYTLKAVRDRALAALKATLQWAIGPCITASVGAVIYGSIGLPLGPIVGLTMVAAATPLCARLIGIMFDLIDTINDPPRADIYAIASPRVLRPTRAAASCGPYTGSQHAFCTDLTTALARVQAAGAKTLSVGDALAKTIARESAAGKAKNAKALRAQQQNSLRLLPQLNAALRAETKAGASVAALLRTNHVDLLLSAGLDGQAISAIEKRLASRGVSASELSTILGSGLEPRSTTLSASLSAGVR